MSSKLFFYVGPGDVLHGFDTWCEGDGDPAEPSNPFSHEFFDLCKRLSAEGRAISSNPRAGERERDGLRAENRPCAADGARGFGYTLGWQRYMLRIALEARRWGADAVFVQRANNLLPFALNALGGVPVVPVVNVRLWSEDDAERWQARLRSALDWPIYRGLASCVVSASGAITGDITKLAGARRVPVLEYLPVYRRSEFEGIAAPTAPGSPFRVLYAGRVERVKGVFDLIEIAERMAAESELPFHFDICGDGGALPELRERIARHPLREHLTTWGHCGRDAMVERLVAADAVIAPTRRSFAEGLNRVVVEAALARRPVVTSRVCPALDLVRAVAVEVPPEDNAAYARALLRLAGDPAFYAARVAGAEAVRERFFDREYGFSARAQRILEASRAHTPLDDLRIGAPAES